MKTDNHKKTPYFTQKRQLLSFAAMLVGVFFLVPGVQLPVDRGDYAVEPAACVGGNFKVVDGTVGASTCVKRLTVPEREGGEASEAVMNGYRHHHKKGQEEEGKGCKTKEC